MLGKKTKILLLFTSILTLIYFSFYIDIKSSKTEIDISYYDIKEPNKLTEIEFNTLKVKSFTEEELKNIFSFIIEDRIITDSEYLILKTYL